jgi:hypothetical protein
MALNEQSSDLIEMQYVLSLAEKAQKPVLKEIK